MPLIVLCGGLCSGKTTRALEIQRFFTGILQRQEHDGDKNSNSNNNNNNDGDDDDDNSAYSEHDVQMMRDRFLQQVRRVELVSDDTLFGDRRGTVCYVDSASEKVARAEVKAAVERALTRDSLVIVDSTNYIKGFRYELHCLARQHNTQHCVVLCDMGAQGDHNAQAQTSIQWDTQRAEAETGPGKKRMYSDQQILELLQRMERPDPRRRWDKPLFPLQPHDRTPLEDLLRVVVSAECKPRPPVSTNMQRLSDTSLLYELDRMMADIVRNLLQAKQTAMPGDRVQVCDACPNERVRIPAMKDRLLTPVSLRRFRQQFAKIAQVSEPTQQHQQNTAAHMAAMFIRYLNTQFEQQQ